MFPNRKRKGENMEPEIVGYRIKQIMKSENIKPEQLAEKLSISKKELEKKLTGKKEFYLSEIIQIKEIFNLNLDIFSGIFFEKEFSFDNKLENLIK